MDFCVRSAWFASGTLCDPDRSCRQLRVRTALLATGDRFTRTHARTRAMLFSATDAETRERLLLQLRRQLLLLLRRAARRTCTCQHHACSSPPHSVSIPMVGRAGNQFITGTGTLR